MTSKSMHDVLPGWEVYTSDNDKLGDVKDVGAETFKVSGPSISPTAPIQPDY